MAMDPEVAQALIGNAPSNITGFALFRHRSNGKLVRLPKHFIYDQIFGNNLDYITAPVVPNLNAYYPSSTLFPSSTLYLIGN